MTVENISVLATLLETMRSDQKWTDRHTESLMIGLEDLPDELSQILGREILTRWSWRPSVKEIRDLAIEIMQPTTKKSAADYVSEIITLRNRYGAHAVRTVDGYFVKGEPAWSCPIKRKVIAAMGGWVDFCEDDSPAGVLRAQLMKITEQILSGVEDESISRLKIAYREQAKFANPFDLQVLIEESQN